MTAIGILDSYRNYDIGEDVFTSKLTRDYLEGVVKKPPRDELALDPVKVVRFGASAFDIAVRCVADLLNPDQHLTWIIHQEDGEILTGTVRVRDFRETSPPNARNVAEYAVQIAATPILGYHRLRVKYPQGIGGERDMVLIVAPNRAYNPDPARRFWGVPLQLYGLRSRRNWGIGDFTDLADAVRIFARHGAAFVGVNPLNALFIGDPEMASPYSPTSRTFFNYLYIDVTKVKGYRPDMVDENELAELRASPTVQYSKVAALKLRVLKELFDPFDLEYLSFVSTKSDDLEKFCVFQALTEHFAAYKTYEVKYWQSAYRDPDSPAVEAFRTANRDRVDFFMWLQFVSERQLKEVGNVVRESGMALGLYQDLPVGVAFNSEEVWANPALYVQGCQIGSPPDFFNPGGQSWGLAPINPHVMRDAAYAPYIEALRALMRYAGVVRIDHAMGMARMFYVPDDRTVPGAYMQFDFEDMLGIVCLESVRNKCMVVAEDLGTPPAGFRERLQEAGLLTMNLFVNNFTRFNRQEIVIAGTHDMPTLPAYWRGDDIALFDKYGMKAAEPLRYAQRRDWRLRLILTLAREGVFFADGAHPLDGKDPQPDLVSAIYRYLAGQASQMLAVQLEDIFEQYEQVNLPGTFLEYPNWRHKLPVSLEKIAGDKRLGRLVQAVRQWRV